MTAMHKSTKLKGAAPQIVLNKEAGSAASSLSRGHHDQDHALNFLQPHRISCKEREDK